MYCESYLLCRIFNLNIAKQFKSPSKRRPHGNRRDGTRTKSTKYEVALCVVNENEHSTEATFGTPQIVLLFRKNYEQFGRITSGEQIGVSIAMFNASNAS